MCNNSPQQGAGLALFISCFYQINYYNMELCDEGDRGDLQQPLISQNLRAVSCTDRRPGLWAWDHQEWPERRCIFLVAREARANSRPVIVAAL